jgi:hypothetical protein
MLRLLAMALLIGLTFSVFPVDAANAASGTSTHSITTTAPQAASGASGSDVKAPRTPTSSLRPTDVYHVGKSFVDKKRTECRHTFKKPKKRRICQKAQGARAVATKFAVTQFRSKYFYIKWHKNAHKARKCFHHHKWCAHNRAFRFMTIANCGHVPWAPPKWHFRYACLKWRAGDYHSRWLKLAFFRNHSVPRTATALLRLAYAKIGPDQKPSVSASHHFTLFGGPYEAFTLNRAATVAAHNQVDLADGSLVLANGLCVMLGFTTKVKPLALGCSAYVTAAIEGVKNDINQAYSEGRCVQFRLYYLYVVPGAVGPVVTIRQGLDATSVVNCPSGRTSTRR